MAPGQSIKIFRWQNQQPNVYFMAPGQRIEIYRWQNQQANVYLSPLRNNHVLILKRISKTFQMHFKLVWKEFETSFERVYNALA